MNRTGNATASTASTATVAAASLTKVRARRGRSRLRCTTGGREALAEPEHERDSGKHDVRQVHREVLPAEIGRAHALHEDAQVEKSPALREADHGVESVEDAHPQEVRANPVPGPQGDDRADEAGEQMDDVVDGIDLEQAEQEAVGVRESGRVRDEKNADEPHRVHPRERRKHRVASSQPSPVGDEAAALTLYSTHGPDGRHAARGHGTTSTLTSRASAPPASSRTRRV